MDGSEGEADGPAIWRSLSDMDVSAMGQEASRAQRVHRAALDPASPTSSVSPPESPSEATEAEADADARSLRTEKEETESSDDNTTQYSVHPPFDFPYFLLLQGYSYRQVRDRKVLIPGKPFGIFKFPFSNLGNVMGMGFSDL